jgi:hypothetical protein
VSSSGGAYQGAAAVSVQDAVTQALFDVLVADRRVSEGLILPQGAAGWVVDQKDLPVTMTAKLSAGFWFAEVTAFTITWLAELATGGKAGAAVEALEKLKDKTSWLECLSKAAQAAHDGQAVTSQSIADVSKAAFSCADVLIKAITGSDPKGMPALLITILESGIATVWGAVEVSARNFLSIWRPSLTRFGWRVTPSRPASSCPSAAQFLSAARNGGAHADDTIHGDIACRDGWAFATAYAGPAPPEPPQYVLQSRNGSWTLFTTVIDGYPSNQSQCSQLPAWIKQQLNMNCQ